jgi:flavoprotein
MKLLITGSRKASFEADYEQLKAAIECYAPNVSEILHGGAKGIDTLAQLYAEKHNIPTTVIKPDYEKHTAKIAPLIRNTELVALCDGCIAYYKESQKGGTLDTAKKARKAGKLLVEILDGKAKEPVKQLGLF